MRFWKIIFQVCLFSEKSNITPWLFLQDTICLFLKTSHDKSSRNVCCNVQCTVVSCWMLSHEVILKSHTEQLNHALLIWIKRHRHYCTCVSDTKRRFLRQEFIQPFNKATFKTWDAVCMLIIYKTNILFIVLPTIRHNVNILVIILPWWLVTVTYIQSVVLKPTLQSIYCY